MNDRAGWLCDRAQTELPEMWFLEEVSSLKRSCFLKLCPVLWCSWLIANILSRNFNDLARCLCSRRVLFVFKILIELGMDTEDCLKEHTKILTVALPRGMALGGRKKRRKGFPLLLLPLPHFLQPGSCSSPDPSPAVPLVSLKAAPWLGFLWKLLSFFPMWSFPGTPRWSWLLLLQVTD